MPLSGSVTIPAGEACGAYTSMRKTRTDFAVLNAAAVRRLPDGSGRKGGAARAANGGSWRIAVGARPGAAQLCPKAAEVLGVEPKPTRELAEEAGRAAAAELSFGSDVRGSGEYRKQICEVLIRRVIEEVAR